MKNARKQGKRDAINYQPRFIPKYSGDRDLYNEGYDEGLAMLRSSEAEDSKPDYFCVECGYVGKAPLHLPCNYIAVSEG